MQKINLEEILQDYYVINHENRKEIYAPIEDVKSAMIEFGEQLLELAAKNAELKRDNYFSLSDAEQMVCIEIWNETDLVPSEGVVINKNSILDTINQVE